MKSHQLQWRVHPDGEWKFHSMTSEPEAVKEMMAVYHARTIRTFDYRLVEMSSCHALQARQQTVYAGRMEQRPGVF